MGTSRSSVRAVAMPVVAVTAAFLSLGATDCDEFTEVTVPRTDDRAPRAIAALWRDGEYIYGEAGDPLEHVVHTDGSRPFPAMLALAASVDSGGGRAVRMRYEETRVCCEGGRPPFGECSAYRRDGTEFDEQPGLVGSTVSNGVYVSRVIDERCPAGESTVLYRLEYEVRAWDFHGNRTTSEQHLISYLRGWGAGSGG